MKVTLDYHLFTEDPYKSFGVRYHLPRSFWVEIYHNRYLWRGYSVSELSEIITILSKKKGSEVNISDKTIRRWLNRTEIFNKAQKAIDRGVKTVDTEYFDKYEQYLVSNYKLNGTR